MKIFFTLLASFISLTAFSASTVSFNSVVAGHKAMMDDIASISSQVLATESRIKAADRPRRSQLLVSAIAKGQAAEFNPQDPTQNMMLAYVYNIDRDIGRVARLTSMGRFSEARAEKEKIDKIVMDNFELIHEMTHDEFSHLGPAGERLRHNATMLIGFNVWAGTKVNIHGYETNVYDVLREDGVAFHDIQANNIQRDCGLPASVLYKEDEGFREIADMIRGRSDDTFGKPYAKNSFLARIAEQNSEGSTLYSEAVSTFGNEFRSMVPALFSFCSSTDDAADVLKALISIGESLPPGSGRASAAMRQYEASRIRINAESIIRHPIKHPALQTPR